MELEEGEGGVFGAVVRRRVELEDRVARFRECAVGSERVSARRGGHWMIGECARCEDRLVQSCPCDQDVEVRRFVWVHRGRRGERRKKRRVFLAHTARCGWMDSSWAHWMFTTA